VRFLWAKGLNANDIQKEIFRVYGEKCLWSKAVHNCAQKFSQGRSKVSDDARPARPVEIATEAVQGGAKVCSSRQGDKTVYQLYQDVPVL
jgi:hypothetical protein